MTANLAPSVFARRADLQLPLDFAAGAAGGPDGMR